MPRHPRVHAPGLLYHVIVRGNNKQVVFSGDDDYRLFQKVLAGTAEKYPFLLYAYALMPNHVHLMIEVGEEPLSRVMQSMLTSFVRSINKKHERIGHLFQGRYKAIVCGKDSYAMELVRYIHLNPVRAGIVTAPEEWRWSGHGEYAGTDSTSIISPQIVRELFGDGEQGYGRYVEFLHDGMGKQYEEKFHPGEAHPFLGAAVLEHSVQCDVRGVKLSLDEICAQICRNSGISEQVFKKKRSIRQAGRARREFINKAVREHGYRNNEVAGYLGCNPSSITRAMGKSN